MAGFTRAKRQAIIDDYLVSSGQNSFVPHAFIDWLSEQPDHEAYDWFFGISDEAAAREHRVAMARSMASGLRITAKVSQASNKSSKVAVSVREFPAMVSPVSGRNKGGGYQSFSPTDPDMVEELSNQGAQALTSWIARYRGVAELNGVSLEPLEKIAAAMRSNVVVAA